MLIFLWQPYLIKGIDLFRQKMWARWINKHENLHPRKKIKKINNEKNVSQFFIKPQYNFLNKLVQDTIHWMKCVVHYLNMKMKGKSVEIIELRLGGLLKRDHE